MKHEQSNLTCNDLSFALAHTVIKDITKENIALTLTNAQWCSSLRHRATCWKVASWIPDRVTGIFH